MPLLQKSIAIGQGSMTTTSNMIQDKTNQLLLSEDGSSSVYSGMFDVSYHSKYGAINESETVFINAGYQCAGLAQRDPLRILEMGFGTGLNPLLTMSHALNDKRRVEYLGVEAYPIQLPLVANLNYVDHIDGVTKEDLFAMHGQDVTKDIEGLRLNPHFLFSKKVGKMEDVVFDQQFDVVYFDAFAPNAQPELWDESMMAKMYALLTPNGVLVTYCAKGVFKRTLKSVGFELEMLDGPTGKREMTRAVKRG